MMTSKLNILLIQVREDRKIAEEEHIAYYKIAKMHPLQIKTLNVFKQPLPSPHIAHNFDAIIIGGASGVSVCDKEKKPFFSTLINLIKYCTEINKPVFGTCYGFQLMALATGGSVVQETHNPECGCMPISLTHSAKKDPLCATLPSTFLAISIHKDKVFKLPESCESLAYNNHCIHGLRIKNKPLWGFQFHPEALLKYFTPRFIQYGSDYTNNKTELTEIINSFQETPAANKLILNFIQFVLQQK